LEGLFTSPKDLAPNRLRESSISLGNRGGRSSRRHGCCSSFGHGVANSREGRPIMAESSKPNYFFTSDATDEADNSLEIIDREVSIVEADGQVELDFEEFHTRWWPGDPCDW
jgi:hypothetical protein